MCWYVFRSVFCIILLRKFMTDSNTQIFDLTVCEPQIKAHVMCHIFIQWSDQPHQRTQCMHKWYKNMDDWKICSNWTTTKQKHYSFPFRLPWNLLLFPSLIRLLLALTTTPSLILPGTLDSFLTSSVRRFLTEDATKTCYSYIFSRLDYCNCLLMGTPNSVI